MSDSRLREAPLTFRSALGDGHDERASDTLNLLPYAEALAEFIHGCETPKTIGIQGDWGSGKTSLMNMLRGIEEDSGSGLLDQATCQVLNFETWPYSQFNDGNALVLACMGALTDKLQCVLGQVSEIDPADLESASRSAAAGLQEVRDAMNNLAGDAHPADVSAMMLRFREEFAVLVDLWVTLSGRRRVVVFIDDLDRVRPSEALLLLEAVNHFMDVPGCVFVMAVDFDTVQHGMAEVMGERAQVARGKALYDKIIHLPFIMPAASYSLDNYITGLLEHSGFPFAAELAASPRNLEYLHNIALCTVGRNPRNIKRAVSYARLLLGIRERRGASPPQAREVQILFALVCMQIAWPELFEHFVHDPTVDTVTSLQNWHFLDRMPEAMQLFQRESDVERVKNNIATFFDTLFTLLDENGDGQIEQRELAPVLEVMSQTCMSAVESRERPRDAFIRRVRENNVDNDPLIETFLEKVFCRSTWYLGSECRYRESGTRYVTLVHQGVQIGSLVTLRNQPFVFRLALSPEKVLSGLKAYWKSKQALRSEAITLTRSVFGKEASMTGFGDTVVDYSQMTNMPSSEAIGLLNALFRIVTGDELPSWELEDDGKKK